MTIAQLITHVFPCNGTNLSLELPSDFETSHSHYIEGDYMTYYRLDATSKTEITRLTLHCGSMVELPHLSDSTFIVEQTSEFERSGIQMNGRFWKELNLSRGVNIFYQDATAEQSRIFDDVIKNLLKQINKH